MWRAACSLGIELIFLLRGPLVLTGSGGVFGLFLKRPETKIDYLYSTTSRPHTRHFRPAFREGTAAKRSSNLRSPFFQTEGVRPHALEPASSGVVCVVHDVPQMLVQREAQRWHATRERVRHPRWTTARWRARLTANPPPSCPHVPNVRCCCFCTTKSAMVCVRNWFSARAWRSRWRIDRPAPRAVCVYGGLHSTPGSSAERRSLSSAQETCVTQQRACLPKVACLTAPRATAVMYPAETTLQQQ